MRTLPFALFFVLVLTGVSQFAATPVSAKNTVQVTKHSIRINNINYRRNKAEDAALGSFGVRRGGARPFFEHEFDWIAGDLKIKEPTTVTLTSDLQRQFNLSAAVDLSKKASGSGSVGGSGSVDASYTLVKLTVADKFQAMDQINKSRKTVERLKSIKKAKSIRMITEVWVLVKGTESQTSSFVGSGEATYKQASGSFSVASSSGSTFLFSAGSVMAYTFDRIKFDSKHQKKWSKVISLDTDIYRK